MAGMIFEWDEAKDLANQRKHGVGFKEAARVFADPLRLTQHDRLENGEVRWQTIGEAGPYRILLVAHLIWDEADNEVIRIISARPVTRHERRDYEEQDR
ncbi:MAG: BrnT family toxin [Sphingomonadaceae bacterium]